MPLPTPVALFLLAAALAAVTRLRWRHGSGSPGWITTSVQDGGRAGNGVHFRCIDRAGTGVREHFCEQLAIGVPMDDGTFAAAVTELSDANLPVTNATLFVALKGIFDSLNSKKARDFFNRSNDEFREARIRLDQLVRYGRDQETEGLPATLNSFLSSPAGLPWAPGAEGDPYIFYRDDPSVAKKPRAFAERFQLAGGLCHQHAPAALSRAVQARSVEDGEARFVDMTSVRVRVRVRVRVT